MSSLIIEIDKPYNRITLLTEYIGSKNELNVLLDKTFIRALMYLKENTNSILREELDKVTTILEKYKLPANFQEPQCGKDLTSLVFKNWIKLQRDLSHVTEFNPNGLSMVFHHLTNAINQYLREERQVAKTDLCLAMMEINKISLLETGEYEDRGSELSITQDLDSKLIAFYNQLDNVFNIVLIDLIKEYKGK